MYVASTVGDHLSVAEELRTHIEPLIRVSDFPFFFFFYELYFMIICSNVHSTTRLTLLCGPTITPIREPAPSTIKSAVVLGELLCTWW